MTRLGMEWSCILNPYYQTLFCSSPAIKSMHLIAKSRCLGMSPRIPSSLYDKSEMLGTSYMPFQPPLLTFHISE